MVAFAVVTNAVAVLLNSTVYGVVFPVFVTISKSNVGAMDIPPKTTLAALILPEIWRTFECVSFICKFEPTDR